MCVRACVRACVCACVRVCVCVCVFYKSIHLSCIVIVCSHVFCCIDFGSSQSWLNTLYDEAGLCSWLSIKFQQTSFTTMLNYFYVSKGKTYYIIKWDTPFFSFQVRLHTLVYLNIINSERYIVHKQYILLVIYVSSLKSYCYHYISVTTLNVYLVSACVGGRACALPE